MADHPHRGVFHENLPVTASILLKKVAVDAV